MRDVVGSWIADAVVRLEGEGAGAMLERAVRAAGPYVNAVAVVGTAAWFLAAAVEDGRLHDFGVALAVSGTGLAPRFDVVARQEADGDDVSDDPVAPRP